MAAAVSKRLKVEHLGASHDLESVKSEMMNIIEAYDLGVSETELSRAMLSVLPELRAESINALASSGKIQICKRGPDLVYRAVDSKSSFVSASMQSGSGMSLEERAVYQVVERAGSKGIWSKEIRNQTKLPMNQMTKVLKNLETKKLIKAVKSVTAAKKKLYMLYGVEPDKSITGGAWYSGTEFESEYVQILYEQCYNFVKRRLLQPDEEKRDFSEIRTQSLVSSADVKDHIDKLEISTVKLTLQDIEMVLETIVFDGLIEKVTFKKPEPQKITVKVEKNLTSDEEDADMNNVICYYRALSKVVSSTGVMRFPCGQCPYVNECRPGAVINPENCLYIERW